MQEGEKVFLGASSNGLGIICPPLVGIGLTDQQIIGGGGSAVALLALPVSASLKNLAAGFKSKYLAVRSRIGEIKKVKIDG
mgnify:CR=1 FL=1